MGKDLMHTAELKDLVRQAYCAIDTDMSHVAKKLYTAEQLKALPSSAITNALGVGNHLLHAEIRPGDIVLDLGCGAGADSILAARMTGPTGRVLALDFLPEMLEKTGRSAREAGLTNVVPLHGEMEAIPLSARSVDVIISNGAINLSPRKMRVLMECARVLKPAGHFCVADLTVDEEDLPDEILTHPAAWAG